MVLALAHLHTLAAQLPFALDGEAETANNTGLGLLSVASIALTYVGLFALWFFVFRSKSRAKRDKDHSD